MICETWEGLTVDGKFPLLERLDGGTGRCLFLTVRQGINTAGIRLVVAGGVEQDTYLAKWESAKTLSHPSLVQLMESGRSSIRGSELVYVVMDKTETVLSGIIPKKALAPAKVKEILDPIVDALSFLHERELTHGSVKPSNIVLIGDQWKLASDEMAGADDPTNLMRDLDTYDAPEVGTGRLTPAADVWPLGIIAIEAFAQKTPMWDRAAKGDLGVPELLPEPFREIARGCLRWEPGERISIGEIKSLLTRCSSLSEFEPELRTIETGRLQSAAATVTAVAEPIPMVERRAEPRKKEEEAATVPLIDEDEDADELIPRSRPFATLEEERKGVGRVIFVGIILLVLASAIFAVRGYLSEFWHSAEIQGPSSQPSSPSQPPASETASGAAPGGADQTAPQSQPQVASPESPGATPSQAPAQSQQPSGTQTTPLTAQPAPGTQATANPPASSQTETQPAAEPATREPKPRQETQAPRRSNASGAVAERVMPSVAPGARESMRRPLEVEVRVSVNESGAVSNAEYVTQGPGNYFARISRQAAESWKFQPPESNGHPRASEWTLRFRFDRSHVEVVATEIR